MSDHDFKGSRILIVEDEESLAVGLEFNLNEEGYQVSIAPDGRQAIDQFDKEQFDLVILDIMLPYLNGYEVAEHMRQSDPQIPILMLTARTGIKDRIKGLETGADDYIAKPFHLEELLLRVKGMLRRKAWYKSTSNENPTIVIGNYTVNFNNLHCVSAKNEFRLTPHEAMLLKYLIDHKDTVVSRQELLENVWQIDKPVETRTVDIFMARLRKYFETNPKSPQIFKSVRSAGYLFSTEH